MSMEKILWFLSNIIVLFASVCFQLGYNPIAVAYDQVIRKSYYTRSWKTVLVKSSNNKFGVLSFSGDTIMPCVFNDKVLSLDISKTKRYLHGKNVDVFR